MENIVKAMQDPKTGIPVRTQKIFLATIPNQTNADYDNAEEAPQQCWIQLIQMTPARLVF